MREESNWPTLWTLYEGAVRIKRRILREAPPVKVEPSPYQIVVRTPNIVLGTRGTEFVVSHDPETQTSTVYVISGELDYYNLATAGPDDAVITTGQKLMVTEDGTETVIPFTEAEMDSLMVEHNLGEPDLLNQKEFEVLFDEAADDTSSGFPVVPVIIGVVVIIVTGFAVLLFQARKRVQS